MSPPEDLPRISTVENPAIFYDGSDVLLSYEVAPVDGGGIAILRFSSVIYFEQNSCNLHESGKYCIYPASAWSFTEVLDAPINQRFRFLRPRVWAISFNDVMVIIQFEEKVRLLHRSLEEKEPSKALRDYLCLK